MKIKNLIIMAIRGNTAIRKRLKDTLDISEPTLYRLLTENNENDDLTKAAALKVIREELGLTDSEILEELGTESDSLAKVGS